MDGQYWKGDGTMSTNEWLLTSDFWQFLEPWHGRWYENEIFIASCTDNIYDLENERWLLGDICDWSCWDLWIKGGRGFVGVQRRSCMTIAGPKTTRVTLLLICCDAYGNYIIHTPNRIDGPSIKLSTFYLQIRWHPQIDFPKDNKDNNHMCMVCTAFSTRKQLLTGYQYIHNTPHRALWHEPKQLTISYYTRFHEEDLFDPGYKLDRFIIVEVPWKCYLWLYKGS